MKMCIRDSGMSLVNYYQSNAAFTYEITKIIRQQ